MILLVLVSVFGICYGGPLETAFEGWMRSACKDALEAGGMTRLFARNVAHRLHSLSLEDVQQYFKADATEQNGVPTVNKDLASETRVLGDAPRAGYDVTFATPALRYLDMVLKDMDKENYSITNFSILEKIAHVFHMAELWHKASIHYSSLQLQPPSPEMCACATNTHLSTIYQELNLLAYKIKYPGITSGKYEELKDSSNGYNVHYSYTPSSNGYNVHYSYSPTSDPDSEFQKALEKFDFTGEESEVVKRISEELVDGDTGMEKPLDSEDGWAYWKGAAKSMDEIGNYEFAMFMYCTLNQ